MRWKPALNAFAITFGEGSRPPRPTNPTAGNTVREIDPPCRRGLDAMSGRSACINMHLRCTVRTCSFAALRMICVWAVATAKPVGTAAPRAGGGSGWACRRAGGTVLALRAGAAAELAWLETVDASAAVAGPDLLDAGQLPAGWAPPGHPGLMRLAVGANSAACRAAFRAAGYGISHCALPGLAGWGWDTPGLRSAVERGLNVKA